jgi:hypothetical protein
MLRARCAASRTSSKRLGIWTMQSSTVTRAIWGPRRSCGAAGVAPMAGNLGHSHPPEVMQGARVRRSMTACGFTPRSVRAGRSPAVPPGDPRRCARGPDAASLATRRPGLEDEAAQVGARVRQDGCRRAPEAVHGDQVEIQGPGRVRERPDPACRVLQPVQGFQEPRGIAAPALPRSSKAKPLTNGGAPGRVGPEPFGTSARASPASTPVSGRAPARRPGRSGEGGTVEARPSSTRSQRWPYFFARVL